MLGSLLHNPLAILTGVAIVLDTVLGFLRACRERRFNSSVGIDGAIRKAAMIASIVFLSIADTLLNFDMLFFIPEGWLSYISLQRVGLCEFFAIMFVLYESVSILKNMLLCGLPIPHKLRSKLEFLLKEITQEIKE